MPAPITHGLAAFAPDHKPMGDQGWCLGKWAVESWSHLLVFFLGQPSIVDNANFGFCVFQQVGLCFLAIIASTMSVDSVLAFHLQILDF